MYHYQLRKWIENMVMPNRTRYLKFFFFLCNWAVCQRASVFVTSLVSPSALPSIHLRVCSIYLTFSSLLIPHYRLLVGFINTFLFFVRLKFQNLTEPRNWKNLQEFHIKTFKITVRFHESLFELFENEFELDLF